MHTRALSLSRCTLVPCVSLSLFLSRAFSFFVVRRLLVVVPNKAIVRNVSVATSAVYASYHGVFWRAALMTHQRTCCTGTARTGRQESRIFSITLPPHNHQSSPRQTKNACAGRKISQRSLKVVDGSFPHCKKSTRADALIMYRMMYNTQERVASSDTR